MARERKRRQERQGEHSSRREVVNALRDSPDPLGVTEVAKRIGLHPNTVRFHLDALVEEGAVERAPQEPSGPGRPRTVYTLRSGMDRGGGRSYRLLAQILLSRLAASGAGAADEAAEAGRLWGRYLVDKPPPFQQVTSEEAMVRFNALLAELGFDPQTQEPGGEGAVPDRVRLRHCPFLELAEEYGQLVCPLHLGLMQGALAGLRAPLAVTRLEPFAQPDACLAHLAPVDSA